MKDKVFARSKVLVFVVFLPWLVLLGWMAEVSWFLTDDAFISFRYVRNLLEGHGLVFNRGERVEGYSNFLWILELAALWGAFGLRPEHVAPWLSVAFTAGTIAAVLWWVTRLPSLPHRKLVGWMALGLVCSSATFAVWTSGGGLETRQFTFFIVVAVVGLSLYRESRHALLVVSLSLAAAALTRPEGPLFAVCCFAWYAVQRRVDTGRWGDWRAAACLVVPFVVLVAGHYLFRYSYYGEWLPNTYYAKHVRPWYEAGFRYLGAAALETGLYLLLPLAVVSLVKGWRRRRCLTYALPLLCIVSHAAYIARIGGDHFEYRPLDFYWPLLAVPAAEGIVHLGSWISTILRRSWSSNLPHLVASLRPGPSQPQRFRARRKRAGRGPESPSVQTPKPRNRAQSTLTGSRPASHSRKPSTVHEIGVSLVLFLFVLFYSGALQAALLFEGARIDEYRTSTHLALGKKNAGWLLAALGMPMLTAVSNHLRLRLAPQFIGLRFVEHRNYAANRIRGWQPYENMERDAIPSDAIMAVDTIGIPPYYVPDLTVVDTHGLTDATVARNPVSRPNHQRVMAHDRRPPSGYLEKRGFNFIVYPAVSGEERPEAFGQRYVARVGRDLWMPFNAQDHQWVIEHFAGRDLHVYVYPTDP